MEESKAAAYYEELTRKGEGAARFKQGLGYSSSSSNLPPPSSSTSSSLSSSFVRASSPTTSVKLEKDAQLRSIHNKLNRSNDKDLDAWERQRHRSSREEEGDRRDREGSSWRRRRRREEKDDERANSRRHSSDEERSHRRGRRSRSRSRSLSPRSRRSERRHKDSCGSRRDARQGERNGARGSNVGSADYSRLIPGYDKMTAPERLKAKMKFQLSQTAAKDTVKETGWERFDFDKYAPLDDEEIEVAEDDAALVKDLGRSFRFSAVEAKREANLEAAHDKAMFGASDAAPIGTEEKNNAEVNDIEETEDSSENLLSDKAISLQRGSWRERASKLRHGSDG